MQALEFWKTVTMDRANLLERLIALLEERGIRYCVIGGVAVNAYAEAVVTLDLDLVVAVDQVELVEELFSESFTLKRYPHSLNVSSPNSDLRVQIQTDPKFGGFPEHANKRNVLDLILPVARLEDVLMSKVWAAQDSTRRPSKRIKDLADIARLLETHPELRTQVPEDLLSRLREHGV